MTMLVYRKVYVQCPRAVAADYWDRPWPDVLDAARRGTDGLLVHNGRPALWQGPHHMAVPLDLQGKPLPDVCFLAEGQQNWEGKTVLFQQNWTEA